MIYFATVDPANAINTLSSTVLGALVVILLLSCGYLLNRLLKAYDEKATVLREVLTAINNFVSVQKDISDRERKS